MKKSHKDKLRKILVNQREQALQLIELKKESAKPVELDQTRVGRLTRMDAMQQQAMARDGLARLQQELQLIDAALTRIDTESYGECIKCGEEIEQELLELNPTLLACKACRMQEE